MYCVVSFITNDNAGTIALTACTALLMFLVYRINIKVDSIKNRKAKEFEEFLIRYDERQGIK